MKLLLTGATGFFGSNLLDLLLGPTPSLKVPGPSEIHTPPEVHALQRSALPTRPGCVGHQVDLFDDRAVTRAVAEIGPTHLCHLAWLGPETEDRYRSPANRRWVEASISLFDAFFDNGGRRLVHLGSCIEYGNRAGGPRIETQALDPDTAYGRAKAELSAHLATFGPDRSTAVARPFFCYGPHEQPDRLVSSLILALQRGETIDLTEGRQRRDYLDVRDVARALLVLLDADTTGPFNIGSGVAVEVRTIAELLGRLAGRPELLNFGGRPEGADSAPEIVADIGRITSATNWKPTIGLEQGLQETTEWWLRQIGPTMRSGGGKS